MHWFTDLSGAEPTPTAGSEKFVLKFPPHVLLSICKSFPVVQRLAYTLQTALMEQYLVETWREQTSTEPPKTAGAVALMRLVLQAQGSSSVDAIAEAITRLSPEARELLEAEMGRSGVHGQAFSSAPMRGGPAFLVYYSPAFVRHGGQTALGTTIAMLAEVYRAARALFPLQSSAESVAPNLAHPNALTDEPHLINPLNDRPEARLNDSCRENSSPNRILPFTDRHEPNFTKERMLIEDPRSR